MKATGLIRLFFFFLLLLVVGHSLTLTSGCANIIPPEGGPRDTLPPTLLRVTPPDSSLGFKDKTITFYFDEYVELQDVRKNVLVSPTPERDPDIEYHLRTVTVKLRDTLEANTTYSIDFGNAIQDINERNPLRNFTYMFSTGRAFDSLEFIGNVILAETGKVDTSLIVMLHRTGEDSAVINKKPRYITRLNRQGYFHFRFLPPGTYYVYALKDDNGLGKYFSTEQLFAFADEPVLVSDSTRSVTLYAYATKREAEPSGSPLPGISTGTRGDNEVARLRFTTSLSGGVQDLLDSFSLRFPVPLQSFSPEKLTLSRDTSFTPVTGYSWVKDSTARKLTLAYALQPEVQYNLILEKEFATDSTGLQLLKSDTLNFRTKRPEDYGSVRIRFTDVDTGRGPVLMILQNDRLIMQAPLVNGEFFRPLFNPGTYELALLYDENRNGKWDPGEFFGKHKQPELVVPLKDKLDVKRGWENEKDIRVQAASGSGN